LGSFLLPLNMLKKSQKDTIAYCYQIALCPSGWLKEGRCQWCEFQASLITRINVPRLCLSGRHRHSTYFQTCAGLEFRKMSSLVQQFLAFCIFQFKFPSLYGKKNVYYGNCIECLREIRALHVGWQCFSMFSWDLSVFSAGLQKRRETAFLHGGRVPTVSMHLPIYLPVCCWRLHPGTLLHIVILITTNVIISTMWTGG
jgi:hypothetical protein